MDSPKVICLSQATPKSRTVLIARRGKSKSIKFFVTTNRLPTTAEKPMTRSIFAMFEPMAFAVTTSVTPLNVAANEEINSGQDVPIPTIVTPTIKGERPKARPIFSALTINQSALFTNTTREIMKTIIQRVSVEVLFNFYFNCSQFISLPLILQVVIWRWERDLNPRYPFGYT